MRNALVVLSFLFCSINFLSGQSCYVRLSDASGFNTDAYQADLEAAACDFLEVIPLEFQDDFKIYDFGFYSLLENAIDGYQEVSNTLLGQVQNQSPYYLLFGKKSDNKGLYTELWIELKMPIDQAYPCLTEEKEQGILQRIKIEVERVYEEEERSHLSYYLAEIAGINKLKLLMDKAINCCFSNARSGTCSSCDYTQSEIADNLDYMGYTEFDIADIEVNIEEYNYPGPLESDYKIDFLDPELGNPSLTDLKQEFLTSISQYGQAACKVYYFDESNCNEFDELLENQLSLKDSPSLLLKKNNSPKLYDEKIVVVSIDETLRIFHKIDISTENFSQSFPTMNLAPWNCYVRKKFSDAFLNLSELEKVFDYAEDIFTRNGFNNVNYVSINDEEVNNLQLFWYTGFFNFERRNVTEPIYGEAVPTAHIPSKTLAFLNHNNNISTQRSGESEYYSLGYLLAHESLHFMVRLAYYQYNPRDPQTYYNSKAHNNSQPNLNTDARNLIRDYGGVPIMPPTNVTGAPHPAEFILHEHTFWMLVSSNPYDRPNSN